MPTADFIEPLAKGDGVCLIGPAGCGKTEEIIKAAVAAPGRQLVLTHTHAGVASLRLRLKKMGVSYRKVEVDTIASWALKYSLAFPGLSGITTKMPVGDEWKLTYQTASELLTNPHIRRVVQSSYAGLFVDEYQDCTLTQHKLVLQVAEIIPTRVIGDPLQGIFGFSEPTVDFDADVLTRFERLSDLAIPHRWLRGGNTKLGEWLLAIRPILQTGGVLDLSAAPVEWYKPDDALRLTTCRRRASKTGECVIVLRKWPNECRRVAKNLSCGYTTIEEMDCKEWMRVAGHLDSLEGSHRAKAIMEAIDCCVHLPGSKSIFAPIIRALGHGDLPSAAVCSGNVELAKQICDLAQTGSPLAALGVLKIVATIPGLIVHRRDYWHEMQSTLRTMIVLNDLPFAEAAWRCRAITRTRGRSLPVRVVSTTLLVKGLECDHVVIWDADEFADDCLGRKNLYVGITRGCQSLTIFSSTPRIALS